MVSFKLFAGTNIGLRENNEDNFTVCPDLTSNNWIVPADYQQAIQLGKLGCVMVVADGMGGQNAGEVASAIAIETVQEMLASENIPTGVVNKASSIKDYLKKIIFEADVRVKEYSLKNPEAEGMGSTIIIAWTISRKLYVAWLGDSRAYSFVPENGIERMSKDHSYVQQLVDAGKLTDTEAMNHPNSNIITRSLGDNTQKAKADVAEYDLVKGEVILLCSDGLCGVCKDEEIEGIIEDYKDNLQLCKEQLTEAALNNGGSDNITITLFQVCDIDESQEIRSSEKEQQSKRRFTLLNIFVCLLLFFLLGTLLFAGSKIFNKKTPAQEYSIKLQLEKDTLECGKTIGFKVEGVYGHYILKYDPKIIKVNVKTSQISLKAANNVAGKGIEKAMLKVTCKEDTSKYDVKYIYLKKREASFKDILGGRKTDIEEKLNTGDEDKSDENPSGDNEGTVPDGSDGVTASGGKGQSKLTNGQSKSTNDNRN